MRSSLLSNVHEHMTDPQPKSQLSFIVDGPTNADEIHRMFASKCSAQHFEIDEMSVVFPTKMMTCFISIASASELGVGGNQPI